MSSDRALKEFEALVMRANDYNGQENEVDVMEDRQIILKLAAEQPELVEDFFKDVETVPGWKELSEKEVNYFIEWIDGLKYFIDSTQRPSNPQYQESKPVPSIKPMNWGGGLSGRVAVIKVTV